MTEFTGKARKAARSRTQRISRGLRVLGTAFGFAGLGVFSLLLWVTWVPLVHIRPGSSDERQIRTQNGIHYVARLYLALLEWMGLARIRCIGGEDLKEPGSLIVANHPTLLDAVVLMSIMPQADLVVKERYHAHPFLGGISRAAGYIPSDNGPDLVSACVKRLVQGRSVIIFPEGTRSPRHGLGVFTRGAAHMALRAGRDPIPVTIHCDPPTLDHGQPWWEVPERRFTLTLRVGESIRLKDAVRDQPSRGRAARALTSTLRDYFERRVVIV
jgi:1-acyl-sn-glycerol-3-phosphate acyltransferase